MRPLSVSELECASGGDIGFVIWRPGNSNPGHFFGHTEEDGGSSSGGGGGGGGGAGPVGDGTHYYRGEDGKIYMTEAYASTVDNGGQINWGGVASDLLQIGVSAAGFFGYSLLGVIAIGAQTYQDVFGNRREFNDLNSNGGDAR